VSLKRGPVVESNVARCEERQQLAEGEGASG